MSRLIQICRAAGSTAGAFLSVALLAGGGAPASAQTPICLSSAIIPTGKVVVSAAYAPNCTGPSSMVNQLIFRDPDLAFPICTNWLRSPTNPAGLFGVPDGWSGPVAEAWVPQCDTRNPPRLTAPTPGARNAWFITCVSPSCKKIDPPGPTIAKGTMVDAATALDRFAPDSIASIYGTDLAQGTAATQTLACETRLGKSSVVFEDRNAKAIYSCLLYVSPGQINFVIPNDTYFPSDGAQGSRSKAYIYQEKSPTSYTHVTQRVPVTSVAPALFQVAAGGPLFRRFVPAGTLLRDRGGVQTYETWIQPNGLPIPVDFGPDGDQLFLILYGTGLRHKPSFPPVTVTVGGMPAQVQYADASPEYIGVEQINVYLPRETFSNLHGPVEIVLRADDPGHTDKPEANHTWLVFK